MENEKKHCPFCNVERGTTCDYLEPIKDKCKCDDYRKCFDYLTISAENGDSFWCALDAWEDGRNY